MEHAAGRLHGKAAFVLGAAGRDNMAQTIARRFVDEGARVVVAGRGMDELERFAGEIGGHAVRCDITDRGSIRDAVAAAKKWLGGLDAAVNATGWGLLKPFLDTSEDEFDRITAISLRGPFLLFQALIEAMTEGGSIIQISSATSTIMLNDHAAYMGAKAGTDHIVRIVAHEFGARGIRANTISPGLTRTPMTQARADRPGMIEAFLPSYPLGRIGTSDDIAAAAAWLASDECFMTGETLQVNGGLTLRANPTREQIVRSMQAHTTG
ncbi:SDR family oxidoreductase [Sphingomonas profundi]|uniref:SDR family oxidoreductase n=1 Tax=Alterirhizorhabdus profundi TaxID=2681549 RepID=UPI0012E71541|nr:SDR family oxidoreductase [Sphingomonas profundi]